MEKRDLFSRLFSSVPSALAPPFGSSDGGGAVHPTFPLAVAATNTGLHRTERLVAPGCNVIGDTVHVREAEAGARSSLAADVGSGAVRARDRTEDVGMPSLPRPAALPVNVDVAPECSITVVAATPVARRKDLPVDTHAAPDHGIAVASVAPVAPAGADEEEQDEESRTEGGGTGDGDADSHSGALSQSASEPPALLLAPSAAVAPLARGRRRRARRARSHTDEEDASRGSLNTRDLSERAPSALLVNARTHCRGFVHAVGCRCACNEGCTLSTVALYVGSQHFSLSLFLFFLGLFLFL